MGPVENFATLGTQRPKDKAPIRQKIKPVIVIMAPPRMFQLYFY